MKEDSVAWLRRTAAKCREFYLGESESVALDSAASEIEHLRAENARLRATLSDAIEFAEEGWGYASEHFRNKWDYAGQLAALKAALEVTE